MKILLGNHQYLSCEGSETFTLTLASALQRSGAEVTIYSPFAWGEMLRRTREQGIEVCDDLDRLAGRAFDVVQTSHNLIATELRSAFPSAPLFLLSHGVLPFLEQPPAEALAISRYLAVSEEVRDNLLRRGVPAERVLLFRNRIDTERFRPEAPIRPAAERVLILSKRMDEDTRWTITEACRRLGLSLEAIGHEGARQELPERFINRADLCISLGRGILETMACARAAFVFDYNGGDGWVTPESVDEVQKCNFSGRRYRRRYDVDALCAELRKYRPEMGRANRELVEARFSAAAGADELLALYQEAIREPRPGPLALDRLEQFRRALRITREHAAHLQELRFRDELRLAWDTLGRPEEGPGEGQDLPRVLLDFLDQIRNGQTLRGELDRTTTELQKKDRYLLELEANERRKQEQDLILASRGGRMLMRYYRLRDRVFPPGSILHRLWSGTISLLGKVRTRGAPEKRVRVRYFLKNYGAFSFLKLAARKTFQPPSRQELTGEVPAAAREKTGGAEHAEATARLRLRAFLASGAELVFPAPERPVLSVILLFYNRAAMSLQCLENLDQAAGGVPYEVIGVDNGSQDETGALLARTRNLRVLRNPENLGFVRGCNQAAAAARGTHLLFLNNDTQPLPGAFRALTEVLDSDPGVGAVGGKLIFPDGTLQEAGSIIWRDGSCYGYGRQEDPFQGEYSYVKDVAYCSGAMLLTPRELFLALGGFDTRYDPAYYEEVDYCMKLREQGRRVVYTPFATAVHYEFGGGDRTAAIALQVRNRERFRERWRERLAELLKPLPQNVLRARELTPVIGRVLFIDDQLPDARLGSGLPRTLHILRTLAGMGYGITFFPLQMTAYLPEVAQELQRLGVEVLYHPTGQKLDFEEFLRVRGDHYPLIVVSRPHNMQEIGARLRRSAPRAKIIYDAEAIYARRKILMSELFQGRTLTPAEQDKLVRTEVDLTRHADLVLAVSRQEADQFVKFGVDQVAVLGHAIEPAPTPAGFAERRDLLFVGGILGSPSPNEDAVLYFVREVFPRVRKELACRLQIVGTNRVRSVWDLAAEDILVEGRVDDLTPVYDRSRVFVAPTRYAAGIPLKVIEAAAHGVPAVVTPLIREQLDWEEDREVLVGHDPEDFARKIVALYTDPDLFARVREQALDRVRKENGPQAFAAELERIFRTVLRSGPGT